MFEENGKQNKSKANASLNAFSLSLITEFCWEGCFLGLWMVNGKGKYVIKGEGIVFDDGDKYTQGNAVHIDELLLIACNVS